MCFLEILYEYHGAKDQPTSVLQQCPFGNNRCALLSVQRFFFHSLIVAKLTVDYCVDKSPRDPIAKQLNPIYTFTPHLRSTLIVSYSFNQSPITHIVL